MMTESDRLRLDAVDEAVLAEARAAREHEQELARIESTRLVRIEELRGRSASDRRQRIGWALTGLAIVTVILAITAAVWTGVDRARGKQIQQEQIRQQTAQECIRAGNIWLENQGCLITQRGTR